MLVIGLPGRLPEQVTSTERTVLTERPASIGNHTFVHLPSIPTTPKELTEFLGKLRDARCGVILIPTKARTPEHTFGVLLMNGVQVVRVVNKLEILTSFVGGKGLFEFCGNSVAFGVFPKMDA